MSLRRPTAALLIYLHPFEESFQTLDLRMLFLLPYYMFIFYLHACITDFVYFVTDVIIIKYFGAWLPLVILYPRSWCLRVHSNVLTGLSLAIVLARFLAWREHCDDSPGTHVKVSSLAKIGVILVSCSCGKWSPIDADEPQTASAINH